MTTPPNQVRKRFVLIVPAKLVDKPIVYELCRDFQVSFNILNASISPAREGRIVIELAGPVTDMKEAELHLGRIGVQVESLNQDVQRHEDRCIHCGTCYEECPISVVTETEF